MDSSIKFNFLEAVWFLKENDCEVERMEKLYEDGFVHKIKSNKTTVYVNPKGVIEFAQSMWSKMRDKAMEDEAMGWAM